MKLCIFDDSRIGIVVADSVVDVTDVVPKEESNFLGNGWVNFCEGFGDFSSDLWDAAQEREGKPIREVKLRAPVTNPTKIVAAAANYKSHVQEMQKMLLESDDPPWMYEFGIFLKSPSSIIGPGDTVMLPDVGNRHIQHESELALVIGKRAKDISAKTALDHVLGYTCLIDITVRGDGDRSERKSHDGFSPVGPWLVTSEEIPDPQNLGIRLWVNGELRQESNSSDMLNSVAEMVSYASKVMVLNPGDLLTTGSPPGVGDLHGGDEICVEIEKIGEMRVSVRRS